MLFEELKHLSKQYGASFYIIGNKINAIPLRNIRSRLGSDTLRHSISKMSGRGEIQSKVSRSSLISCLTIDRNMVSLKNLTLYDGDGRVSLNSFGIITFFTKIKINKRTY